MMKGFRSLSFLSLAFLFIFLTGCGKSSPQKIKLFEVTHSIFYTPQYVAIEKGFFKEEGLDVELTNANGGDKAMTALLSNNADIILMGAEATIYVKNQGAPDPAISFAK